MTHEPFIPWYWKSLDFAQLARDFPPPPDYVDQVYRISRDELRARGARRNQRARRSVQDSRYTVHEIREHRA